MTTCSDPPLYILYDFLLTWSYKQFFFFFFFCRFCVTTACQYECCSCFLSINFTHLGFLNPRLIEEVHEPTLFHISHLKLACQLNICPYCLLVIKTDFHIKPLCYTAAIQPCYGACILQNEGSYSTETFIKNVSLKDSLHVSQLLSFFSPKIWRVTEMMSRKY